MTLPLWLVPSLFCLTQYGSSKMTGLQIKGKDLCGAVWWEHANPFLFSQGSLLNQWRPPWSCTCCTSHTIASLSQTLHWLQSVHIFYFGLLPTHDAGSAIYAIVQVMGLEIYVKNRRCGTITALSISEVKSDTLLCILLLSSSSWDIPSLRHNSAS